MAWTYLPVVSKLLQILVTIAIGVGGGALGIISDQFITHAVEFVFYIALPCLIVKGIGIGIDFYAETNIWAFIAAFLILRAVALLLALLAALLMNWKAKHRANGPGYVAVLWLTLTWISTVILGVPISSAVFGNSKLGIKYGILAGISSFIFQLPIQLAMLECHVVEEQTASDPEHVAPSLSESQSKDSINVTIQVTPESSSHIPVGKGTEIEDHRSRWSLLHVEHLSRASLWLKIGKRVLKNPVLWGICIGFVVSLSTAGKYLRCPSETCISGLEWIGATLGWLGDCVTPISLVAMGVWMHGQGTRRLFAMQIRKLSLFMISKLIIVPLVMVGLSKGLKLENEGGRAAILIAALPISMASFCLGHQYDIGTPDLATNVAVGTLLMLPTVLLWNIALDKAGLYPIAPA
ncbi:hypothetical protein ACHAXR_013347 [Thalassiosira sp. AJA248-18]